MKATNERPSLRTIFDGRRGALLIAYLLTEFAASVDGLSYAAVLPVAARELDGIALYAPAVTATGVVSIAFMAIGAFLYGRLGPRIQLWIATLVYLGGAALTFTATAMEVIVLGMAVRGVGSGLMAGVGIGVLSGLYPNPQERERALGLFALMWVIPSLIGPVVNGFLLVTIGWRASMAWPAVLLLLGRVWVSRNLCIVAWQRSSEPVRVRGAGSFIAVAAGLMAVQAAVVAGGPAWLLGAIGGIALVLLLPYKRAIRVTAPGAYRAQNGGWLMLLVCASYFGVNALLPLLAARYVDASGVIGAILVSLGPLTWAALSGTGLSTRMSPRAGYRVAAILFPAASVLVAVWALTAVGVTTAGTILLALAAVLIGAAMGTIYPKIMSLTFEGFREERGNTRAHGGVVLGLSENVGTVAGATILTGIGASVLGAGTVAIAWLASTAAAALLVVWLLVAGSSLWRPPIQR